MMAMERMLYWIEKIITSSYPFALAFEGNEKRFRDVLPILIKILKEP